MHARASLRSLAALATPLALGLAVALAAGSASAQTDLTGVQATGEDTVKISVRRGPRITVESGMVAFTVDGGDNASWDDAVDLSGTIDDSGRQPVFTVTNWSGIESQVEALIDAADPALAPSNVVVDTAKSKVKLAARLRGDLTTKLRASFPFLVNGTLPGKLQIKVEAVEPRPPACHGMTYFGIEQFTGSVRGLGSARFKDEPASLALANEMIPFDRMLGFTYTNPLSTPNTVLTGVIDFTARRPEILLDGGSVTALQQNLADVILSEAGVVATVALMESKTSFKCTKDGGRLQFRYSAKFLASSAQGAASGKVTIQSKMEP